MRSLVICRLFQFLRLSRLIRLVFSICRIPLGLCFSVSRYCLSALFRLLVPSRSIRRFGDFHGLSPNTSVLSTHRLSSASFLHPYWEKFFRCRLLCFNKTCLLAGIAAARPSAFCGESWSRTSHIPTLLIPLPFPISAILSKSLRTSQRAGYELLH